MLIKHLLDLQKQLYDLERTYGINTDLGVHQSNIKQTIKANQVYDYKDDLLDISDKIFSLQQEITNKDFALKNSIKQLKESVDNRIQNILSSEEYQILFLQNYLRKIGKFGFEDIDLESFARTKLTTYSNWHYPGMTIDVQSRSWVEPMIASDPLYLVYNDNDSLDDKEKTAQYVLSTYPETYQKRVRVYILQESSFEGLPKNQFGLICAWNVFNRVSHTNWISYLSDIFNLLRPGGTLLFNLYFDFYQHPFTPHLTNWDYFETVARSILEKIFTKIGYSFNSIEIRYDLRPSLTHKMIVELKKPGTLKTIKAAQAMGKII